MTSLLAVLALGFFLGMRHATDPDHVIAVSTIVARERSPWGAAVIGAAWGVGHTLTILVVGSGIVIFKWVITPRVGLSMELAVGGMLIVLGLMNLSGILDLIRGSAAGAVGQPAPHPHDHAVQAPHVHSHAHRHGDYVHTHPHAHQPETHPHDPARTPVSWLDRHLGRLRFYQLLRPLAVGVVHGLAGSAAVALLVLTTLRSPRWAVLYLGVFGVGTIVGMMLITALISVPFTYTGKQFGVLNRRLRIASGVISLAFGLFIAYRIGFVEGLFTGTPR
jgi:ABC-type nickel/cobalt efflux system permease component RcnA